jgi:hypothetical protein
VKPSHPASRKAELGEDTSPRFPEAATLLRLLSPAANFQAGGADVPGGLRLTHLHATRHKACYATRLPGHPMGQLREGA